MKVRFENASFDIDFENQKIVIGADGQQVQLALLPQASHDLMEIVRGKLNLLGTEINSAEFPTPAVEDSTPSNGSAASERMRKSWVTRRAKKKAVEETLATLNGAHSKPAPPQTQSEKMKAHWALRRAQGLCRYCPKKSVKGKTLCRTHLHQNRENLARGAAKRRNG